MAWSTAVSIGRIINGIAASPMHVGSHLPRIPGTFARLDRCPAAHVMRLITNPGIITDANICQINTSPADFMAGTMRWSSMGFCEGGKYIDNRINIKGGGRNSINAINYNSADCHRFLFSNDQIYLVGCDGFINTIADYISDCHAIAQMHQSLWDERS